MAEPEKIDPSSQPPAAGPKSHLFYKSLLNQCAQKLRIQFPVYQTYNEGVEHLPQFRSTVWFDGVSYTSSNTFQQRKIAEMDVSKIAFFAMMQRLKNEAFLLIHEDKTFCKSILAEYAAKMNITKPSYQTSQLDMFVPAFCSSLVFEGVSYTGDEGKTKKEAEQFAARAVILKYLDSRFGNIMSEIINCKCRHYAETNKPKETNDAHDGTNMMVAQSGSDNVTLIKAKAEADTNTNTNTNTMSAIQGTYIPTYPSPGINLTPNPDVSIQQTAPVVPVPTLTPQTVTISAPGLQSVGILGTDPSNVVIPPQNSEASRGILPTPLPMVAPALEHIPFAGSTSGRKRNRKNKKNARKRMCVDAQTPIAVVPTSQASPCSAQ